MYAILASVIFSPILLHFIRFIKSRNVYMLKDKCNDIILNYQTNEISQDN